MCVTRNMSSGQDSDDHHLTMFLNDFQCLPDARFHTSHPYRDMIVCELNKIRVMLTNLSPCKNIHTGMHKHTVQQLPDGSLKGTVCDATNVRPSRRPETPHCVSSESTKMVRASGVGREQGS